MQLILSKPFPVGRETFKPGKYQVGSEISETHAKCAVADGFGSIKTSKATKAEGGAPENK